MSEKKRPVGRPRQGSKAKKVYSVRIEPSMHDEIKRRFGSISKALVALYELRCAQDEDDEADLDESLDDFNKILDSKYGAV